MFDGFDFFDAFDAAEAVSDVSEVGEAASDWSDATAAFDGFEAVSDFSSGAADVASGADEMSSLGFETSDGLDWQSGTDEFMSGGPLDVDPGYVPGYDYGYEPTPITGGVIYENAIGPGLNGTPGAVMPTAAQDGGFFGGIKSALGAMFQGTQSLGQNRAYRPGSVYVSGRGVPYQAGRGNSLSRQSYNDGSLFGRIQRAITGQPAPRRGMFESDDGSSMTAMMMLGGLALLGVALLAKR